MDVVAGNVRDERTGNAFVQLIIKGLQLLM